MKSIPIRRGPVCRAGQCLLVLVALVWAFLPTARLVAASATPGDRGASMEAIHASYLDLTSNVADLRSRVSAWQAGDEDSLGIAREKLDRIQVVLASVAWPDAMLTAIAKTQAAVDPMSAALEASDAEAAKPASESFGDASHDVTHAFYGDWLPALQGVQFTNMAAHAAYLDLAANVTDLRSRIAQWQEGDASSLNIAKEKVERINVLIGHMSTFGVLGKPLQALSNAVPAVAVALETEDAGAAQTALQPIADASHDLTHDFYSWVNITAGVHDPDCVQASYLDLSRNLADLRARIGDWQNGDESGLNIAQEKLDRMEAVLGHVTWPDVMAAAIGATRSALPALRQAVETKDLAAAAGALQPLGDASHDLTHAYYGDWLPAAHSGEHMAAMGHDMGSVSLPGAQAALAGAGNAAEHESQPHSHGNAAPAAAVSTSTKGLVLGGFASANGLVIVAAAILKSRAARLAKGKRAARANTAPEGSSQ